MGNMDHQREGDLIAAPSAGADKGDVLPYAAIFGPYCDPETSGQRAEMRLPRPGAHDREGDSTLELHFCRSLLVLSPHGAKAA